MNDLHLSQPKQNAFGEVYYEEINNLTFAKQSSETVFKNYFASLLDEKEQLFIIVGTDSGLLYQFIKKQPIKSHVKFVFIELSSVIQALGLNVDTADKHIHLVDQSFNFSTFYDQFETYVYRKKYTLIRSLAVMDAAPSSAYEQLWQDVETRFSAFNREVLVSQRSSQFEDARLYNVADNILPVMSLKNKLEGATAVVLGGGPTLDDAITWVKDNQQNLVIFAAARVARRLVTEGIVPDFFVSVDPHDVSFDNSKGIFAFEDTAVLINGYHVNPKLLSQWAGLSCYMGLKYGWMNTRYTDNFEPIGPTVINTAVHVSIYLGCSNVILSGVDFCFAKGKSHESSSDEAKASSHLSHKSNIRLVTNAGQFESTEPTLAKAREALEYQAKFYQQENPNVKLYSTGLNSAKVEGVEYLGTDSINFLNPATKQKLADLKQLLVLSPQQRLDYAKLTLDELQQQSKAFKVITRVADEALEWIPKLYKQKASEPKFKVMNKVQKLRKKVNRLVGADGDLLLSYQGENFADTYTPVEQDSPLDSDVVTTQLNGFFQGVKQSAQQFDALILRSQERAQLRIDELEGKVSLSELFKAWQMWGEFGRAKLWSNWHKGTDLISEELALLQQANQAFQKEVEKTDTKQFQNLKRAAQNLGGLADKASTAFNQGSQSQLESLLQHAEQLDNQDQKRDLSNLIQGMIAELQQNEPQAIKFFKAIEVPDLKLLALKRLLNFAMQAHRYEEAMALLENLCLFSLDYMVPYSDLLALLGNESMAIEVLKMYLSQKQDNISAHIKLAQRQINVSANQEAKASLQKVLSIDPGNQTALHLLKSL
ncbi:MAG: motility associated factor glycosyltransferase family protein [Thiomicrospira sp.]|uniref:6-hydroxymethylpterin diphosphokinase MptE-like protein n=1 Tax=Thiomicrospira sp. TaxID=935 RepID=UPI0019EA6366|nr:6-hydroxymethylpterin diphosphokinase MptE-like protein [Thiomicrospira sp.]MBE0494061.1 motility associated factor glycosyltransferase family protein [Thiomicrospira sp.]